MDVYKFLSGLSTILQSLRGQLLTQENGILTLENQAEANATIFTGCTEASSSKTSTLYSSAGSVSCGFTRGRGLPPCGRDGSYGRGAGVVSFVVVLIC